MAVICCISPPSCAVTGRYGICCMSPPSLLYVSTLVCRDRSPGRLLSAALELPYWALPGSWVNEAGTEVTVDPLQVLGEGGGVHYWKGGGVCRI